MRIRTRSYGVAVACISFSGCIPWVDHYPLVEKSGAVYYRTSCSVSTGPPAIAYFPFHGVFVSISVNGTVRLGLHVPRGYSVQIDEPTVQFAKNEGKTSVVTYQIKAFPHGVYGDPAVFHRLPDPYTTADNFGPLMGDGEGISSRFYLFLSVSGRDPQRLAQVSLQHVADTVTLPALTINGQHYDAQTLRVALKSYFELAPLNC